ncbi:unnamed protein product [Dibothriocephalus latus]|uniref:Uncharacterized protein n=1 Tax=Dibothriocephalus latus TaxID=60516 RepID=A0A3P7LI24_DIBLA|nr:unnamed protein product [Dibothriocephalus latus]
MNVSFDVGLPEYSILLNSIFADFEAFLALEKGKKPAVKKTVSDGVYKRQRAGGGAQLASLNARLTASCPKVPSFCGQIVASPESAFTCRCVAVCCPVRTLSKLFTISICADTC